jgi:hypothetical protein
MIENHDLVGSLDSCQAVRHDDACPVVQQLINCSFNALLCYRVESR